MTCHEIYDLEKFGNIILDLRNKRKITQTFIRDTEGLHPKTIKNLEYGNTMPNLDTLNKLSNLYRVNIHMILDQCKKDNNRDFKRILEKLDKISLDNKLEELEPVLADIKKLKTSNKDMNIEYIKNKLDQIDKFAELIKIKNKTDIMNVMATEQLCIQIIQLIHPNFDINNINTYYFNPLETRVLIALSFSYIRQNRYRLAVITLNVCIDNASLHVKSNQEHIPLLIHAKYALSYVYFINDENEHVISICDEAISLSKDMYNVKLLPHLYFRKGISEYLTDNNEYKISLRKSLDLLGLMDLDTSKELYTKILKDKYSIHL